MNSHISRTALKRSLNLIFILVLSQKKEKSEKLFSDRLFFWPALWQKKKRKQERKHLWRNIAEDKGNPNQTQKKYKVKEKKPKGKDTTP